jgi:hypothetical protein
MVLTGDPGTGHSLFGGHRSPSMQVLTTAYFRWS